MINSLTHRVAHWNLPSNRAPREEHDLTDSMPYPFAAVEGTFVNKCVLEIGPGRGRQYDRLKSSVMEYSICDIAPDALKEKLFLFCRHRFLLKDYSNDFGQRFDIVHFWYVLHHVQYTELRAFFEFVARHLRAGGVALFNTPIITNPYEPYPGDGLGTTRIDRDMVLSCANEFFRFFLLHSMQDRSTGYLFGATKR